jgi:acetyl esterase/lipase
MYQQILRKMSKDTGYPVFSVDYRLSPEYPHPIPLSDCWMVYLWLQYYSAEYLQLTFDKIILVGDSAGGNL